MSQRWKARAYPYLMLVVKKSNSSTESLWLYRQRSVRGDEEDNLPANHI
jgi:hypothetical protein